MTSIPAGIAAEAAITRQNVALSVIKQNADQSKAVANILEQAVQNAPADGSRGTKVDLFA